MRLLVLLGVCVFSARAFADELESDEWGKQLRKEQQLVDRDAKVRLTRIRQLEAKGALSAAENEELREVRVQYVEFVEAQKSLKTSEAEHRERRRKLETRFDRTRDVSPICSVHGARMKSTRVPVAYGM